MWVSQCLTVQHSPLHSESYNKQIINTSHDMCTHMYMYMYMYTHEQLQIEHFIVVIDQKYHTRDESGDRLALGLISGYNTCVAQLIQGS